MNQVTLGDVSLRGISLDQYDELGKMRDAYFQAVPEICIERPCLVTNFHLEMGLLDQPRISILDKARVYRKVLEEREPIVSHTSARDHNMREFSIDDTSPFAGSTTSKFKGVLLHPELLALAMWSELNTVSDRSQNPFFIDKNDIETLTLAIFPHWLKKSVWEITRYRDYPGQFHTITSREPDNMTLLQNAVFFITSKVLCISHAIPDFSKALDSGLGSMIEEAIRKEHETSDSSKKQFYQAVRETMEGIISYSTNLANQAREDSKRADIDPAEKSRLEEIAQIYRNVPKKPARTFREALTTVWICWTAIHLENPNVGMSLGRLDQVLYPYYKRDISSGALTVRRAIELICYLWLKIGDHVPMMPETGEQLFGGTGSNQAITLGGVDKNGNDAVNDLTYIMLKATELMRLRDPNLNARYHSGKNSDEYLKRITEVNIKTGATPAIHNDRAVFKALRSKGHSTEQAWDYGIVGCVEPVSAGRTYGHNAAIILNLASTLEMALFQGKHRHTGNKQIGLQTDNPAIFNDYAQFWDAFKRQTECLIDRAVELNNQFGKTHQDFYPTPILSAFFEGPMDKGVDLIQGGATINSSGAAIVGFADVVDSLAAIRKWVFEIDDNQKISFPRLLAALSKDFVGNTHEAIGKLLWNQNKTPKFGNEHPVADQIARDVVTMLDEQFGCRVNYRGGHYRVGYWTMTIHAAFGKLTQSLPNGRKARQNFASGITPVSNVTPYLSKALGSVAQLPAEALSSGVALNIKYTPETDVVLMRDNFAATVKAFFSSDFGGRDGGFEIQFNIVSRETLKAAQRRPELHGDLLVRVSGYTAYFRDLNPQMQEEIIQRTEYLLSTGNAQHCIEIS
ncbi:MAG: pyruvate formate lyase family protein [Desulfomonilaceae bacterium]|jgi:formate C-acetyltransferase